MNKTFQLNLGGHLNRTNDEWALLKYVKKRFKVKTIFRHRLWDPGGMKEVPMVWVLTGMV